MSGVAKNIVNQIIQIIDKKEQYVRKELAEDNYSKNKMEKDFLKTGWAKGIFISWDNSILERYKWNKLSSFFEWNGIVGENDEHEQDVDTDLTPITKEMFENEIIPGLKSYLQEKVDKESYGGLYDSKFTMTITLKTHREEREDDPGHMKGSSWLQTHINVEDSKREEEFKEKALKFIQEKEYLIANIKDISDSLTKVLLYSVKYFYPKFSVTELIEFYTSVFERSKESSSSCRSDIIEGFANIGYYITNSDREDTPTEEEFKLANFAAMQCLLNGRDKYERDWGKTILNRNKDLGSNEAKEILKYGTGKIDLSIMQYKDKLVNCSANDINKIIDIKIKEESEEAYRKIVEYIIRLMEAGFPNEYTMKFNSKEKEYLPIYEVPSTKANNFWYNAAKYPNLHPLIKEYIRNNMSSYDYYSDATDESAVSIGGYATFALGLASDSNNDIVEEFMRRNDTEHTLTTDGFVSAYLDKYGITKDNVSTVVTALTNINGSMFGVSDNMFNSLKDEEILTVFVNEIEEEDINPYVLENLVMYIWGSENELEEAIEEESGVKKEQLQKLYDLLQEED